ncbi:MAG TPA: enoyl-CoA hydratase-related protein [Burkholderiales bacterium]|nr:enoyl-CoA hydratase-related protein [Burkholderiales bacterium]
MSDKVQVHIDDDGNATVLLNRPEVHNALDPEMMDALTVSFRKLDKDPKVRAVVLMGSGESFCAGADITHMKKSASYTRQQNYAAAQRSAQMFYTLYHLRKPTIACVRGAVRGGGCGVVAACDIAVASRLATFRLSEVKIGVIPAMISPYVIGAIGERMARRYMLTGEEFDSAEAYRMGLVHDIVEDEELVPRVSTLLFHLYSSGPAAIAAIKALIPMSAHSIVGPRIINETARRIAAIRATPEAQEGMAAFLEKRKPNWISAAGASAGKKARAPRSSARRAR